MILKIPLSNNLPEDKIIWIGNKRGFFIVKSAYYVATKLLATGDEGESSNGDPNAWIWRKLWSLCSQIWLQKAFKLLVYVQFVMRG